MSSPPQLDSNGNPILKKDDDDEDDKKADKSADGIAVMDLARRNVVRKIKVGSDPEQLALSKDGKQLYVSNEDVGTATVLNITSGKVEHIIPVSREIDLIAALRQCIDKIFRGFAVVLNDQNTAASSRHVLNLQPTLTK